MGQWMWIRAYNPLIETHWEHRFNHMVKWYNEIHGKIGHESKDAPIPVGA